MSEIFHNPNLEKKKKKDSLDRGEDITPKESFTIDDLKEVKAPASFPTKTERVTAYASVRINNHIKNKAEALSFLGISTSQKDAIDTALDFYIQSLPEEDKARIKYQIEALEERDVNNYNKKM